MEPISIALSAGGKSTRMGREKGLLPFMGKPLYRYILDQLDGVSGDVFLIANNQEGYADSGFRAFPDKIPDIGALGGIFSALSCAQNDLCLILACDMPFINIAVIELLRSSIGSNDVAIPQIGSGMLEPFRAIYRRSCLPHIERAIKDGERRATGFLLNVKTTVLPPDALKQVDLNLESFLNINTPTELTKIESIAKERG